VNDGYDNHAPGDRNEGLIIALKSLVNAQYLKDISRKVSSSVKARRERGDYFGAYAPYGYRRSKVAKGKLEIDETTAPIVRDIFEHRANGMGQYRICALLNEKGIPCPTAYLQSQGKLKADSRKGSDIWLPTTIKKIIKSHLYLGHVVYGKTSQSLADNKPTKWHDESDWVICENTHEPIVSRDLWDKANAVSEERSILHKSYRKGKSPLPKNIFQGLLSCGHCDSRMERTHNHRTNPSGKQYEYYYYGCASPHKHKEGQPTKKIRLEAIYDAVFPLVVDALQRASNLGAIIEKRAKQHINPKIALDAEITRTSQELETINRRLSGLYESYVDKLLSEMEYVNMKASYEGRGEALRQKIDSLSLQASTMTTDISVSENRWLKAAMDFQNPTELTREMLEAIVKGVKVYDAERVEIVWKFGDELALLEACVALQEPNQVSIQTPTPQRRESA